MAKNKDNITYIDIICKLNEVYNDIKNFQDCTSSDEEYNNLKEVSTLLEFASNNLAIAYGKKCENTNTSLKYYLSKQP